MNPITFFLPFSLLSLFFSFVTTTIEVSLGVYFLAATFELLLEVVGVVLTTSFLVLCLSSLVTIIKKLVLHPNSHYFVDYFEILQLLLDV